MNSDDFDIRVALEVAVDDALALGDTLAQAVAASTTLTPRVAELASLYEGKRNEVRRLRRALTAVVAG